MEDLVEQQISSSSLLRLPHASPRHLPPPLPPSPTSPSAISTSSTTSSIPSPSCLHCGDIGIRHTELRTKLIDLLGTADSGCKGCAVLRGILDPYRTQGDEDNFLIIKHGGSRNLRLVWGSRSLEVFTPIGKRCPWKSIKASPEISGDTGSDAAITQISSWLNACTKFHQGCGTMGRSYLPTRVLEITGPRDVRLYVPEENEIAPYVCLSHCWGTQNCIRTTTSTFVSHQQGIPWDNLQKTFQDAVSITHRLGIRYLWIDSLCIIQDDVHDWRHEGSLMANIYAQCYFTIAATKSSDSHQGCFVQSTPSHIARNYRFRNEHNEEYTLKVREELKHIDDIYGDPDFPLLRRAWVFQERNLSPRTVHFGTNELLWECTAKVECECLSWPWKLLHTFQQTKYKGRDQRVSPGKPEPLSLSQHWYNIVTEYSDKVLTYEKDVLPALQGVARVMQSKRRCQYYAGLWQDTLLMDLLWTSENTCFRRGASLDPKDQDLEVPQTWHAPSWSWASVVGKVEWTNRSLTMEEYDATALATVTYIKTTPVGSDPFGELSSAVLKIRGPCLSATLYYSPRGKFSSQSLVSTDPLHAENERIWLSPNFYGNAVPSGTPVKVMKIIHQPDVFRALVFWCIDEIEGIWERVGITSYDGADVWGFEWFFDQEGEDLELTVV